MATKAKKATAKKAVKTSKAVKPAKASAAKKIMTAKTKKAKPAIMRAKAAKKPAVKKIVKKTSVKKKIIKSVKSAKTKTDNSRNKANQKKPLSKAANLKVVGKKAPAKTIPVKVKAAVKPQKTKLAVVIKPVSAIEKKKPAKSKQLTMNKNITIVTDGIFPYQEVTGEEYMNRKQQEHFRVILLQRKKEFMNEMERTVHHLQDEAINFSDPNDRATQEEAFSLELRTRDRELKYIKNIEDALQRIDEGEYGYCEGCGVEIGVRRLEARPTATLCIDCKTLDEIREKQMGG